MQKGRCGQLVTLWDSQAISYRVCQQTSFLDGRVQCHAHHLLRISGASTRGPALPLAHSPTLGEPSDYGWDGRIPGRTEEPRAPGLSLIPGAFETWR